MLFSVLTTNGKWKLLRRMWNVANCRTRNDWTKLCRKYLIELIVGCKSVPSVCNETLPSLCHLERNQFMNFFSKIKIIPNSTNLLDSSSNISVTFTSREPASNCPNMYDHHACHKWHFQCIAAHHDWHECNFVASNIRHVDRFSVPSS